MAPYTNAPPPFLPVRRPPKNRIKFSFCVFCKNNGEDERYYLGHTLKDDFGRVTCPILSSYQCPLCGASGPVAHRSERVSSRKRAQRWKMSKWYCSWRSRPGASSPLKRDQEALGNM